ncbi:hypothetical protein PQQ96_05935 [Paraburkholderia sediminicola]|uniref:hypothetical protein n=1 Tax=Paraburkholderia sediminicola TaxID=458836 RepID=UPI0038BA7F2F
MEAPIPATTFYLGWRILFDGWFAVMNEEGSVVAFGLRTMEGAKHLVDSIICAREFD